jgi:hypothetical protein
MDPYLEQPTMWPDVHNRLMFAICDQIQPLLSPRYAAVLKPYVAYEAIDIATTRTLVPDVGVLEQRSEAPESAAVAIAPAPSSASSKWQPVTTGLRYAVLAKSSL